MQKAKQSTIIYLADMALDVMITLVRNSVQKKTLLLEFARLNNTLTTTLIKQHNDILVSGSVL